MNEAWQRLGPGVLSIDLVNEEHQAAIYISDDETYRNKLTLKVKNVSTGKVTLKKSDTAHIEVFFPKGVLDEKNLPKPNQIKVSEWGGMGGKDLFNFDQIEDKPLIDMDKLNASAKIDVSGMMDSIDATELEPSDTATRGIKSRSVTSESDLTKLVKESNELKKQALEELKDIRDNKQLTNNPVIQRGLAKFSGLFKKLSDLSSQVDTNIEELYDLQKRVEQGREFAKEEIFNYIQEELSNGVKSYLESIEGQNLFNSQVELSVKDIMANLEGLQLSDDVAKTLSKPKSAAGWNIEIKTKDEGVTIQISKTSVDEIILNSGDYLNIEIANIKPNAEGGTRNSSIELHYPSIDIEGDADSAGTNRFSQSPISIVNRRGQKYASLQLSIVKGQMLLNDGTTPNEVVLRMINFGKDSIYFKNAGLHITYEVQMEGEDESYALTEKDDIVTISMTNSAGENLINMLNGANTYENTAKVGQNPLYEFQVAENQNFELKSGDYWMITIADLKTGLDAGFANIEFSYNNVPEYWDGAMAATVQRTPIVYAESKVGIGVLNPNDKVHIKDNGSLLKLEGQDTSYVQFSSNEDKNKAAVGYADNDKADFSISNDAGNINLAPKKEVTINGDLPFHFRRFEVNGEITPTKYSARDWNAGIVGLGTHVVDFEDGQGADVFRMEIGDDGNWCIHIFRDFSSTDGQNGSIDVMFVSKKISARFDWR